MGAGSVSLLARSCCFVCDVSLVSWGVCRIVHERCLRGLG